MYGIRERVVNTSRSHSEEVNVGGLQPEKTYSVRIVAFNQHGAGSSSDALQVETKSEPHVLQAPSNLLVNVLSSVSLMAEWQSPPSPAATPVHNYKLFYMERGSGEEHEILTSHTSHLIHGLKPYTEYSVWAVALNEKGPGTSTEEITVRTRSDVPSDTPRNLVAEPASSTVFSSTNKFFNQFICIPLDLSIEIQFWCQYFEFCYYQVKNVQF